MVGFITILIDASVFCAYANIDDVHHKKALKILEDIISEKYGKSIASDYVFDETVTVTLRKTNKKTAVNIGNFIINSEVLLIRIDYKVFQSAWEIFDGTKELSFTDCANVALMQMFGVEYIATFDRDFEEIEDIKIVKE